MSGRKNARRWMLLLCAAESTCLANGIARGIVIRDDTPASDYIALSAQPQYAASGYVNNSQGLYASGTLIAPDWVLTAAHVVINPDGQLIPASQLSFSQGTTQPLGAGPDAVSEDVNDAAFQYYNVEQGNDLGLLQLATPITNVIPAQLYTASLGPVDGLGETVVGYGETGTGLTGAIPSETGTRMAMTNVLDQTGADPLWDTAFGPTVALDDFDDPNQAQEMNSMGSPIPTTLEGTTAPGDSGGGDFVSVNGKTYLVAVTSFGFGPPNENSQYNTIDGYTLGSTPETVSFLDSVLITNNTWNKSRGGSWADLSSWTGAAIPEFAQATANFGSSITVDAKINLDADWTVGTVTFNNSNSYTLAPGTGGILTLDNGTLTSNASLDVQLGQHTISAPVVLNSSATITTTNPTDSLTISGAISGAGGIVSRGPGTLNLVGTNTYAGTTTVRGGALAIASSQALPSTTSVTIGTTSATATMIVTAAFAVTLSSLKINAGSTVDVTTGALAIDYSGASPATAIAAALASGYNAGAWNGPGIISSAAGGNKFAVGYADGNSDTGTPAAANQVLVEYTLNGDANLDGQVGFADLVVVAENFGKTGEDWAGGNFTYDPAGSVGFTDLVAVAENFGQTLTRAENNALSPSWQALSAAPVPEPPTLLLIITCLSCLLGRRVKRPRSGYHS